jgi:hypothetical protein
MIAIAIVERIFNFTIGGGEKNHMMHDKFAPDIMLLLRPGRLPLQSDNPSSRQGPRQNAQKYLHVLGPTPKRCLETLADLGMSDPEIGRYFKIPSDVVTDLRHAWRIPGEV